MSQSLHERPVDKVPESAMRGSAMRIVICDDHQLLVEALATSLALQGFTVEATVDSPADAVRAVALHQPHVLVLDVNFPTSSGLDAAREVIAHHPHTKVVMITGSDDPEPMLEALAAGVAGYLRKDQKIHALGAALELAYRGGNPLDEDLLRKARRPRPKLPVERSPLDNLTTRERHILTLLVEGMSTREIVRTISVSESTVRTHVQNIFTKLGVHSRLSAVAMLADNPAFHHARKRDAVLS